MRSSRAMLRFASLVIAVGLVAVPAAAFAEGKSPAPAPSASAAADPGPRDGGVLEGRVTNVDYGRGIISIDSAQGRVDVNTMPTTSVQGSDPGYHTITDVAKGSKVQIFISKTAGKLVAQIIRLIKH